MIASAKSMILKAHDNIETAKRLIDDETQHDIVGYNLAQACEFCLKALCVLRGIEYPPGEEGHDLDTLMELLEEDNMTAISSHADIIDLTPYNSLHAFIRPEERLNLREYLERVEDLKALVKEQVM